MLLSLSSGAGPATRPADPPASTPKEALSSLNLAQRDGDADAIRALFTSDDQRGRQLITAMADYAAALAAFHDAAEKTYGPDGANFITGNVKAESEKGLAAIEKAVVTIDHESATVQYAKATDAPIRLVKIAGRWKLPVVQLLDGDDKESQDRGIAELIHQTRIAKSMADDLTAGKYKEGANRAREVWRSRLLETVKPPTTAKAG